MEITWKEDGIHQCRDLYFRDLKVGDTFKIAGNQAVYVKIKDKTKHSSRPYEPLFNKTFMCELVTGNFFLPTASIVEKIQVDVKIDVRKPNLYN